VFNTTYIKMCCKNLKTMEIISLAYKEKAKSDFDKSVLYAFLAPGSDGEFYKL